jgi:hypothetical protein
MVINTYLLATPSIIPIRGFATVHTLSCVEAPIGALTLRESRESRGVRQPHDRISRRLADIRVLILVGVEARAFVQMHETGHKAKVFGKTDKDSMVNVTDAYRNNFKIWQNCFGSVPTQPWDGKNPPYLPMIKPR